jgi:hypothetical protein
MKTDWVVCVLALALGAFGVFLGVKTRIPSNKRDVLYGLALYAKYGGWILGVFSILGALRLLSRLLSGS